jgi:hypothetical protein
VLVPTHTGDVPLVESVSGSATSSGPLRLAVYSGHDTTILPLLAVLLGDVSVLFLSRSAFLWLSHCGRAYEMSGYCVFVFLMRVSQFYANLPIDCSYYDGFNTEMGSKMARLRFLNVH